MFEGDNFCSRSVRISIATGVTGRPHVIGTLSHVGVARGALKRKIITLVRSVKLNSFTGHLHLFPKSSYSILAAFVPLQEVGERYLKP